MKKNRMIVIAAAALLALAVWCAWYARPVTIHDLGPDMKPEIISIMLIRNGGGSDIEHRDLWLVEETSRYMFRILAAKMLFEDPTSFGFYVREKDKYPVEPKPKETVSVSGPIENLVDFAEEHGIRYATLKGANLWLRDSKLTNKAGKTYEIVIPREDR